LTYNCLPGNITLPKSEFLAKGYIKALGSSSSTAIKNPIFAGEKTYIEKVNDKIKKKIGRTG